MESSHDETDPAAINKDHPIPPRVIKAEPTGNTREWKVEIEDGDKRTMNDMSLLSLLLADKPGTKRCVHCLKSQSDAMFLQFRSKCKMTLQCADCRGATAHQINEYLTRLKLPYRICHNRNSSHLKPLSDFFQGDEPVDHCVSCLTRHLKVRSRTTNAQPQVKKRLSLGKSRVAESYLHGRTPQELSDSLGKPLPDLLEQVRIYLVRFSQDNDHELRRILHNERDYEQFVQGFSPNSMEEDSLLVRLLLDKTLWLKERLKVPGFRERIVGAFSNTKFHDIYDD
ncbi:hypothetical protein F4821DRAFT_258744 [Hypoxylon rubiginosum]|uniref:Uncharacterized protein n=1 Tax=Hypoxylon rubiginosum TaxID=110542 RepID=A0ACC0D4L5_9PEZI|nr:hypothetical protein F4821DRAFT_258744 [Hypoxylon rubiginosum]